VEGFRVSLSECIVGTVLGVDGWRDDERGGVRRRVVVATWLPSIGCPESAVDVRIDLFTAVGRSQTAP